MVLLLCMFYDYVYDFMIIMSCFPFSYFLFKLKIYLGLINNFLMVLSTLENSNG